MLTMLLDAAVRGRGSTALITGEPGSGKTRLMDELAALAGGCGARVLWGRCYEGDGAPAFWPWVQTLRAYVNSRPLDAVRDELGTRAPEIAALVPELLSLIPGLPPPPVSAAQERFRLFDAVTSSLKAAAAATPILLLLDDLHWADTSSLLLLDFLAQELAGVPLLAVGAYRNVEPRRGDPLLATLGSLARRPHVARVVLSGLSVADVGNLIEAATGAPAPADVAATIAEETAGNPLYVTQMVRLLAAEGATGVLPAERPALPATLREVIGRRIAQLPNGCVAALNIAAVMGREFHLALVASASGLEHDAVLDALEVAESAGIIQRAARVSGHYRFSHALIRDALYEDLPTIRRARMHLRIAEVIEEQHGLHGAARVAELAAHYRLAVPITSNDKAVAYARRAGDAAAAVFAWEEAIIQWQTALDLTSPDDWSTRCELLLALGEARNHAGERERAKETFLEAADTARHLRRSGDGKAGRGARYLARAALAYGGPGVVLGALDQRQVNLLDEALAAVGSLRSGAAMPPSPPVAAPEPGWRALSARLLARLALALFWTPRRQDSLTFSQDAVAAARESADPSALIAALHVRRYVLWSPEHLAERSGFAGEMVELAEALGDAELTLQGLRWRVVDGLETGDIAAVDTAIERYEQLAVELRHPYYRWYASLFRATRAISSGRFGEGERLAREALAFGQRAGDSDAAMFFTMQILPARVQQGRLAELAEPLRELVARYPTMLAYRSRIPVLCAELGLDEEARQSFDAIASDTADPAAGEFARVARDGNWLITMVNLARACLSLGDRGRAARLYELMEPYAGRNAVTGAGIAILGPTSHWLGSLAALLGRAEEAAAHFEAALAMAARMEAIPQLALTRHAYAVLLLSAGSGARDVEVHALALLDSALATAREIGMAPLEQEILQAMAGRPSAGSEPPRRATARFPDGLSAREVEVLRLVAAGHSNRQIAGALVLAVITVQNHVANIYRKTRIHTRAQAGAYALRHGLIDPDQAAH